MKPTALLTIGGSDPTAAAGIQLDIKVGQSFGIYVVSALTALTAQNKARFITFTPTSPELLTDQLEVIFEDFDVQAIKLGMLATEKLAAVVSKILARKDRLLVVVDPVLLSSTGAELFPKNEVTFYREKILPFATVLTPNLHELAALTKTDLLKLKVEPQYVFDVVQTLIEETTVEAVFVKDGHSQRDPVIDRLFQKKGGWKEISISEYPHPRLYDQGSNLNARGTGCATATALACGLMKNKTLEEATKDAVLFIHNALLNSVAKKMIC